MTITKNMLSPWLIAKLHVMVMTVSVSLLLSGLEQSASCDCGTFCMIVALSVRLWHFLNFIIFLYFGDENTK